MKITLVLILALISIRSFAQTDTIRSKAAIKNQPSLSTIKQMPISSQDHNDYIADNLTAYSNQARIGLLMEGGGVVLGMSGALLSANSVSATPINISLISGGIISLIGFIIHYDSYRYLKHTSLLLKFSH